MKAFDWVLLVISILWVLLSGLKILAMLSSREVKYRGAKVIIGFWVPLVPVVMWLVIAYRVGG